MSPWARVGGVLCALLLPAWPTRPSPPAQDPQDQALSLREQILQARSPAQRHATREEARVLAERNRDCLVCRQVYALALERSGMRAEASRQWRAILKRWPQDPEALLALADAHVADGLRYAVMAGDGVSLEEFGKRDLWRGIRYLESLRKVAGWAAVAEARLAELALALGHWREAVRHASAATMGASDHRSLAVLATALLRLGATEEAQREFDAFLSSAPESVRALYTDEGYFFTRSDLRVDPRGRPSTTDPAAWDDRDPRILTPENERLLEHYARVTLASVRFASAPGKWDGALTQPGVLLIRYGEPLRVSRTRPSMDETGSLSFEQLRFHYGEQTVVFEDRSLLGRFQLAGAGWGDSVDAADGWRLVREVRERYDPRGGGDSLAISTASWLLPREHGGVAVVAVDIPTRELTLGWDETGQPRGGLAVGILMREMTTGYREKRVDRQVRPRRQGCTEDPVVTVAVVESLAPGTWRVAVEVEDGGSGTWARVDFAWDVLPSFPRMALTLVGPIWCWRDGQPLPAGPLERTRLLPTSRPAFGALDSLVLYAEAHGLKPNTQGNHEADWEIAVLQAGRSRWRPWQGRRTLVAMEQHAEDRGPAAYLSLELSLERYRAGRLMIGARCTDQVGGRTVRSWAPLAGCGGR